MPSGGSFRRLGILYTVGLLLSKNGATFNGTGISPDVEASLSAEEEANFYNFTVDTDPQILRAFEVVDTLTGRNDIQASLEPSQSSSASEAGGAVLAERTGRNGRFVGRRACGISAGRNCL